MTERMPGELICEYTIQLTGAATSGRTEARAARVISAVAAASSGSQGPPQLAA